MKNTRRYSKLILTTLILLASCAHPAPPPSATPPDLAATLIVDNTTTHVVGVYMVRKDAHDRLGTVQPNSEERIPIRRSILGDASAFRVYGFRGQEPCPVARIVDIRVSKTPRITIAQSDTVLSAYLPGDTCKNLSR